MEESRKKGINSSTLKILAWILMFIDHTGYGIVEKTVYNPEFYLEHITILTHIDKVLRGVGRLAFPIFAYQIVVGFYHTKNRVRYAVSLFIFALISEIPFNLLTSDSIKNPSYQNTGFTLLLGMLAIWCISFIENIDEEVLNKYVSISLKIVVAVLFMLLANQVKSDYSSKGVLLIVLMYILFEDRFKMVCVAPAIFLIYYFFFTYAGGVGVDKAMDRTLSEAAMVFAFPFILRDNGIRKGGSTLKWFGYLFYPCHLFIIYVISHIVIGY